MNKIDIMEQYFKFCQKKNIHFHLNENVSSYDETTLFCPAGMQQFKLLFKDQSVNNKTIANIQSCLRLLDLDSIGDGSHFLYFNMIGLFSFRGMSVSQSIKFWMEFLLELNIKPDYVTVHPDKYNEWKDFHSVSVRQDNGCVWSDGDLSGYCTEFYINNELFQDLEIGNIVNICGDCIDVGFGLERLDMIINHTTALSELEVLKLSIEKIINSGYYPSNKKQGYVLRKLIRLLLKKGGSIDSPFFEEEKNRQENILTRYVKLKDRYKDKSKEWWYDTHGIDLELV